MKTKIALTLIAVVMLASAAFADVTITPKKQIYRRPKPISKYKRTFTVTWPKVKTSSPALAKKIEAALSYEKAFEFTIAEEIREIQWLEEASYEVVYNKGNVLCVALSIMGTGAYPDGSTKYVVVDSSTGAVQSSTTVFTSLQSLAEMIAKDQKKEIDAAIIELRKDPDLRDPDPATLFESTTFTVNDLNGFSVDAKGVTFHLDYGFPHVIQAMQPPGEFRYTWKQMRPYIKMSGLLAGFAR